MSARLVPPPVVIERRLLRVRGTVQGVGFRPHVHRQAVARHLTGFVHNDDDGVLIDVEGAPQALDAFAEALLHEAPPAARVTDVAVSSAPPAARHAFVILPSPPRTGGAVPVTPDLATCAECWREFHDPHDRRHRYPFLNCTQCGPRFTIVEDVPYDRARTTMRGFPMCAECRREFETPGDRRHHAQPVACPACGPVLRWRSGAAAQTLGAEPVPPATPRDACEGHDAVDAALACVAAGGVIAVKGIGGYHLVCDARSDEAVARLRARKHRPDQALAVLVADLATARTLAVLSAEAEALLTSPAAPIVIVPRRPAPPRELPPLAEALAPDVDDLGLMLPYTPLHALLAARGPVVCTSANLSQEPIAWRDADALDRLAPLVDGWLWHDRPIAVPCDDSVWCADPTGAPQPVRRSRGYAPLPVPLPRPIRSIAAFDQVLAVGAELKATLAVTRAGVAFLSGHLGDVGDPLTLEALARQADHLLTLFAVQPTRVACDLHPGYLSAQWARRWAAARDLPVLPVQHHHAHLAALQAEHGRPPDEDVLAFTFDGTGYGPDGTIWGGEALLGSAWGVRRVAHLRPFGLPGGDAAVREPSRLALAALHAFGLPWEEHLACVRHGDERQRQILATQLQRGLGVTMTTSAGRLFDACAALVGFTGRVTYEGQAAIRLATLAGRAADTSRPRYAIDVEAHASAVRLDPAPLLEALCADARANVPPEVRARGVHEAIANAIVATADVLRETLGPHVVGLTGGVFQNRLLQSLAVGRLEARGHAVRLHRVVPCNDGGLALGQAAVALVTAPHSSPVVLP